MLDKEDASAVVPPIVAARDLRGDLAALLTGYPQGLYLLRPDRYVAAFFPIQSLLSADDAIDKLVGETWTEETLSAAPSLPLRKTATELARS